jgi:hypothetical protein
MKESSSCIVKPLIAPCPDNDICEKQQELSPVLPNLQHTRVAEITVYSEPTSTRNLHSGATFLDVTAMLPTFGSR